jgi:Protein of unknown function (DUF2567)
VTGQFGAEPPYGAPRTSRARAVLTVVVGLLITGVLSGGLWGWIAPPIHAVVALNRKGARVHDYLGNESQHFFVAPCLLLGLLTTVSIVGSLLVWQWRAHRGPAMILGLWIGLMAGAAAAAAVGAMVVRMRYGALNFDAVPLSSGEHSIAYVYEAPPVFFGHGYAQIATTLLWPVGFAALVWALLAAANARDDLGAYPPVAQFDPTLPWEPQAARPSFNGPPSNRPSSDQPGSEWTAAHFAAGDDLGRDPG